MTIINEENVETTVIEEIAAVTEAEVAAEAVAEAEEKKPAKKTAAKKTTARKSTKKAEAAETAEGTETAETEEKKPAKKAAGRKKAVKANVNIQFAGKEYTTEKLVEIAKDVWQYDLGNDAADFKSVELYVKPEEASVYYVINEEVTGSFAI